MRNRRRHDQERSTIPLADLFCEAGSIFADGVLSRKWENRIDDTAGDGLPLRSGSGVDLPVRDGSARTRRQRILSSTLPVSSPSFPTLLIKWASRESTRAAELSFARLR
jgi:hypothetical protein